jgi:hypothetical protein
MIVGIRVESEKIFKLVQKTLHSSYHGIEDNNGKIKVQV